MSKILTAKPSITDLEIGYVSDAIQNGWGEKCYEYINRFEQAFAEYLGSKFAIATSSCTVSIHAALAALGVGPGDEVIIPDITWVACATPVVFQGATPVFVDVLQDTWCLDPEKFEAAITPSTKVVMPVHVYGNVSNMGRIKQIAAENGIAVLEDAAEALGADYMGEKLGSLGEFGVFSFHGTKTCSTGEGGMIVTSDEDLFQKVSKICNQGRDPKQDVTFWMSEIGFKTKMSNLQAAMGLAQIERANDLVQRKREIFELYYSRLKECACLSFNVEPDYAHNTYWHPTVIFDDSVQKERDEIIEELSRMGIGSRPFFYPVSSLPMFDSVESNTVAYALSPRGLNLPSYYDMIEEDIDRVCSALLGIIG